jgi:hypothetical protein
VICVQKNLGLTDLKSEGPKIVFFIAEILLLQELFTTKSRTEGIEIKFFIAGILLLKGSLNRGFSLFDYILLNSI